MKSSNKSLLLTSIIVNLILFSILVFIIGTIVNKDQNFNSDQKSAVELVRQKFPDFKYYATSEDKSFAGTSIQIQKGASDNYYIGMITHGSGVPIIEINCFNVNINTKDIIWIGKGAGINIFNENSALWNNFSEVFNLSTCKSYRQEKTESEIKDRVLAISASGFEPDIISVKDPEDNSVTYIGVGFFVSPISSLSTLLRQGYDCYFIVEHNGVQDVTKTGTLNEIPFEILFDSARIPGSLEMEMSTKLANYLDPKTCKLK